MKIRHLTQRTPVGYTFNVGFGPFWVTNWWYNSEHNNVTPPSQYNGGKRYGYVIGFGIHFKRLRAVIKRMVELGWTHYDSDDMLLPEDRHTAPVDDGAPVNVAMCDFGGNHSQDECDCDPTDLGMLEATDVD